MRDIATTIGLLAALAAAAATPGCGAGQRSGPVPAAPKLTADPTGEPLDPADAGRIERLARTDHVELLKLCLQRYLANYRDYTCTLTRQERIEGELSRVQVVDVKFKQQPFSVLMTWKQNPTRGDKVLYVENDPEGKHKMYVHPTGLAGKLIRSVERWPDDPEVKAMSLRTVDQFGFARSLQALIEVYEQAKAAGDLIEAGYVGQGEVDGRPTWVLRRVLAAGENYPAKVTIAGLDAEHLLPVHVKGLDWQDQLSSEYTFTDLRFNVGLTDEQFTRQAAGL